MPIVQIYTNTLSKSDIAPNLIEEIRIKGSKALKCELSNVWVLIHQLPTGSMMRETKEVTSPVVFIRANKGRSQEDKMKFVQAISQALSDTLQVSAQDIWIHYQEMNPEDIWHRENWTA